MAGREIFFTEFTLQVKPEVLTDGSKLFEASDGTNKYLVYKRDLNKRDERPEKIYKHRRRLLSHLRVLQKLTSSLITPVDYVCIQGESLYCAILLSAGSKTLLQLMTAKSPIEKSGICKRVVAAIMLLRYHEICYSRDFRVEHVLVDNDGNASLLGFPFETMVEFDGLLHETVVPSSSAHELTKAKADVPTQTRRNYRLEPAAVCCLAAVLFQIYRYDPKKELILENPDLTKNSRRVSCIPNTGIKEAIRSALVESARSRMNFSKFAKPFTVDPIIVASERKPAPGIVNTDRINALEKEIDSISIRLNISVIPTLLDIKKRNRAPFNAELAAKMSVYLAENYVNPTAVEGADACVRIVKEDLSGLSDDNMDKLVGPKLKKDCEQLTTEGQVQKGTVLTDMPTCTKNIILAVCRDLHSDRAVPSAILQDVHSQIFNRLQDASNPIKSFVIPWFGFSNDFALDCEIFLRFSRTFLETKLDKFDRVIYFFQDAKKCEIFHEKIWSDFLCNKPSKEAKAEAEPEVESPFKKFTAVPSVIAEDLPTWQAVAHSHRLKTTYKREKNLVLDPTKCSVDPLINSKICILHSDNLHTLVSIYSKQTKAVAIVNAANKHLATGLGTCGIIHGCTEGLEAENRRVHGGCLEGYAVASSSAGLGHVKNIIHAVGCKEVGMKLLYDRIIQVATENNIRVLVVPPIGTGHFNRTLKECTDAALGSFRRCFNEDKDAFDLVIFIMLELDKKEVYEKLAFTKYFPVFESQEAFRSVLPFDDPKTLPPEDEDL
eukprot:TRINITY_DN1996_c0_g1_i2.p1 TRINITY_DN1996_c0_g1~~TRINITY_DN1996_c0_g1_i2.p1  ORF type:complete len:776 (+),score=147.15 TRINITY_DN1996_c0_g1_i2:206-2533(+)